MKGRDLATFKLETHRAIVYMRLLLRPSLRSSPRSLGRNVGGCFPELVSSSLLPLTSLPPRLATATTRPTTASYTSSSQIHAVSLSQRRLAPEMTNTGETSGATVQFSAACDVYTYVSVERSERNNSKAQEDSRLTEGSFARAHRCAPPHARRTGMCDLRSLDARDSLGIGGIQCSYNLAEGQRRAQTTTPDYVSAERSERNNPTTQENSRLTGVPLGSEETSMLPEEKVEPLKRMMLKCWEHDDEERPLMKEIVPRLEKLRQEYPVATADA